VAQVLVDLNGGRIIGFRLRRGGPLDRRWRVAAWEDVTAITAAAVLLADAVALREDEAATGWVALGGPRLPVRAPTGALLGDLVDAEADLATGRLREVFIVPHAPPGFRWLHATRQQALPSGPLRVEQTGVVFETPEHGAARHRTVTSGS
jgi:hypothetical protein